MQHPFEVFPKNHVRAAMRQALDAATYDATLDIVSHAFYLCERWRHCPYVADAPPVNGRIVAPPQPPQERSYLIPDKTTPLLARIGEILPKLTEKMTNGK